jgi:hypothetical protein
LADYGPPESNSKEGLAILCFYAGLTLWVAGLAYAAPVLQVILVVVGVALQLYSLFLLMQAKRAAAAARAKTS